MKHVSCLGIVLSVISLLSLGASGPGFRWGCWGYKTGITLVKYAGFISLAAVMVSLVGLALRHWEVAPQEWIHALIGLVIGGAVLGVTLKWKYTLDSLPYIHDITTDTENPPLFVAVLPLRTGAENPSEYGGAELAKQQKEAYPDLKPLSVNSPPEAVFPRALQAAKDMGWKIVDSDPQSLRIEATDHLLVWLQG